MQMNFFSYGDFSDERVVGLHPCAELWLLLNLNLSKPRKKENFVCDTCVMHIELTMIMFVSQKQGIYGNGY